MVKLNKLIKLPNVTPSYISVEYNSCDRSWLSKVIDQIKQKYKRDVDKLVNTSIFENDEETKETDLRDANVQVTIIKEILKEKKINPEVIGKIILMHSKRWW